MVTRTTCSNLHHLWLHNTCDHTPCVVTHHVVTHHMVTHHVVTHHVVYPPCGYTPYVIIRTKLSILSDSNFWSTNRAYKKATQIALRWLLRYCLTVLSIGLSIYARFSQSVTCIGLSATVSGQRRPDVSALPLGSKY